MRGRTTGILLLAALALGAYIYSAERWGPGSAERSRGTLRVLQFSAERAVRFEVDAGDLVLRGERHDGRWRLTHPIEVAADARAVRHMLSGFEKLDRHTVISRAERLERDLGLDAFGLDRPRARWTLWEPDARHALWLGQPAAVGDLVYLFDEASEDVIAVSRSVLDLLPASPDRLRDRRLFSVDPDRVRRIELTRPGGFVQMVRHDADGWRIEQPLASGADAGAVRGLSSLILDMRVASFIRDGPGEDALYGFDETGVSAVLVVERPESASFGIELGHPHPDNPDERFARVTGRPGVVTVSAEMYRHLRMAVDELRDRRLLVFGADAVQGLEVSAGGKRLQASRSDNGWTLTSPVAAPADGDAVMALLESFTAARIERFLLPVDAPQESAPDRYIAFHHRPSRDESSAELRRTVLEIEPPNEEGLIPLRFSGSGQRVAVHPLRLRRLSADPLRFVTRRPLDIDPAQVRGFTVQHAGQDWTVSLDADGRPSLGRGPDAVEVDVVAALSQLAVLTHLPVLEPVSFGAAELASQGLDDPVTLIQIHLTDEAGMGKTLALGRRGSEGVFVRVGGQDLTFIVDPAVADLLRRRPVADRRE